MSRTVEALLLPLIDSRAYLHDTQYCTEIRQLQRALDEADDSLTQAGVDSAIRTDIIKTLIKGLPSASAAHERIDDRAEKLHELVRQPPRPILLNLHGCEGCGNPYILPGPDDTCIACGDTLKPWIAADQDR